MVYYYTDTPDNGDVAAIRIHAAPTRAAAEAAIIAAWGEDAADYEWTFAHLSRATLDDYARLARHDGPDVDDHSIILCPVMTPRPGTIPAGIQADRAAASREVRERRRLATIAAEQCPETMRAHMSARPAGMSREAWADQIPPDQIPEPARNGESLAEAADQIPRATMAAHMRAKPKGVPAAAWRLRAAPRPPGGYNAWRHLVHGDPED